MSEPQIYRIKKITQIKQVGYCCTQLNNKEEIQKFKRNYIMTCENKTMQTIKIDSEMLDGIRPAALSVDVNNICNLRALQALLLGSQL